MDATVKYEYSCWNDLQGATIAPEHMWHFNSPIRIYGNESEAREHAQYLNDVRDKYRMSDPDALLEIDIVAGSVVHAIVKRRLIIILDWE